MMANCLDSTPCHCCSLHRQQTKTVECSQIQPKPKKPARKVQLFCDGEGRPIQFLEVDDGLVDQEQAVGTIKYAEGYRQAEVFDVDKVDVDGDSQSAELNSEHLVHSDYGIKHFQEQHSGDEINLTDLPNFCDYEQNSSKVCDDVTSSSSNSLQSSSSCSSFSTSNITPSTSNSGLCSLCQCATKDSIQDKYLVFTMGTKTYTPHQIGIKRITGVQASQYFEAMRYRREDAALHRGPRLPDRRSSDLEEGVQLVDMEAEYREELANQNGANNEEKYDSVDHLIELHGHIIGMCLSPDHRFVWPEKLLSDNYDVFECVCVCVH